MNRLFLFLPTLAVGIGALSSRADYVTTFSTSPYVMDESIVGIDGWESRFPPKDDQPSYAARVVALRWNGGKPGLMLRGASLKRMSFEPMSGEKQRVSFQLAVNFAEGRSRKLIRIIFNPAVFGEVFFDQGAEGGLGYQGDGGGTPGQGTIVLKRSEVKVNSFYTFTFLLDFGKQSYDVSVTGEKKDGSPFAYKADGVAFPASKERPRGMNSLLLLGTGYLGSLSVESK
jgi:hypothetical protein